MLDVCIAHDISEHTKVASFQFTANIFNVSIGETAIYDKINIRTRSG